VTFQVRLDDVVHWPGTRIPLPAQFVTPLCVLARLRYDGTITLLLVGDLTLLQRTQEPEPSYHTVDFRATEVGVSLLTRGAPRPRELCCLSLSHVACSMSLSDARQTLLLNVKGIQLDDNSSHNPTYPVVFSMSRPRGSREDGPGLESATPLERGRVRDAVVQFGAERSLRESQDVLHLTSCFLRLLDVDLCLDRRFLARLLRFVASVRELVAPTVALGYGADWHYTEEAARLSSPARPLALRKVVVDALNVHPMTITITVGRQEGPDDPFEGVVPAWVRALLLSRVNQLCLRWDAFHLHSTTAALWVIAQRLQRHYLRQTLSQAYKLLPRVLHGGVQTPPRRPRHARGSRSSLSGHHDQPQPAPSSTPDSSPIRPH